jgi:hypothetical protein
LAPFIASPLHEGEYSLKTQDQSMPGNVVQEYPIGGRKKRDKTIRHGAEGRNARISALSACGFFATLLPLPPCEVRMSFSNRSFRHFPRIPSSCTTPIHSLPCRWPSFWVLGSAGHSLYYGQAVF